MKLFARRPRPPAEAVARLDPEERVLAFAPTPDGTVVATPAGLWLPGRDRLAWHLVAHVHWNGAVLMVTTAREVGSDVLELEAPVRVRLLEPGTVPEVVQQRFYSSRVHTARHTLAAGGGVIVTARRIPGQDGLHWFAVPDQPGVQADPVVAAELAALLEGARHPS